MHSIVIRHANRSRSVYCMDMDGIRIETDRGCVVEMDPHAAIRLALSILVDFADTPHLEDHAASVQALCDQIAQQQQQAA